MANTQYAGNIMMKCAVSYSVGPYRTLKEAGLIAKDVAFCGVNALRTQRGSAMFLCDDPEAVWWRSFRSPAEAGKTASNASKSKTAP